MPFGHALLNEIGQGSHTWISCVVTCFQVLELFQSPAFFRGLLPLGKDSVLLGFVSPLLHRVTLSYIAHTSVKYFQLWEKFLLDHPAAPSEVSSLVLTITLTAIMLFPPALDPSLNLTHPSQEDFLAVF